MSETLTRDQIRSRRQREVGKLTISRMRLPVVVKRERNDKEDPSLDRPETRGECRHGPRPCPWVSCLHHLYLDVTKKGSLTLNFPDLEPEELNQLDETCALDVADRGRHTLENVAVHMNLTRERVRQIEGKAKLKLEHAARSLKNEID